MNILLFAPAIGSPDDADDDAPDRERIFLAPPQGLHQIAAHLRRRGHCALVFDPNLDPGPFPDSLTAVRWDIVGFSPTHIFLEHDLGILLRARRSFPAARFVLGGMEATFNGKRLLELSNADAVVLGEGERTMADLAACSDWGRIPGLLLREGQGVRLTGFRPALDDEGFAEMVLGVPHEEVPYRRYWEYVARKYDAPLTDSQLCEIRTVRLFTSNMCPRGCAFCSATRFRSAMSGGPVRVAALPPKATVSLVERVLAAFPETRTIFFSDDNFAARPGRVRDICARIVAAKTSGRLPADLSFITSTTIYQVDREMLASLSEAGFRVLDCGVESFSRAILREFRRPADLDLIRRNLDLLLDSPLRPYLTIILASPGATLPDVEETLAQCLVLAERGVHLGVNVCCWAIRGSTIFTSDTPVLLRKVRIPGTDVEFEKEEMLLPVDPTLRRALDASWSVYRKTRQEWIAERHLRHFTSRYNSLAILRSWFVALGRGPEERRILACLEKS